MSKRNDIRLQRAIAVFMIPVVMWLGACDERGQGPSDQEPVADCPVIDLVDNCGNTCTGYPPINDLGTGYWRGLQGGLYPGGSNTRPTAHNDGGMNLISQIQPLNVFGDPDSSDGEIVFLAIGMSNSEYEFDKLKEAIDTMSGKNPYLRIVNGAQGGWDINKIIVPDTTFWLTIDSMMALQGLSNEQVQVIWYKEAELAPLTFAPDTSYLAYIDYLKEKLILSMHLIAERYPNAKVAYCASRIYGGYDATLGNPEPFAYYTGWSVKRMIEDQINGDPSLIYEGTGRNSPWLAWGDYIWADGLKPRSDGLIYVCPDDFLEDGRHPSDPVGRVKVAMVLMDFFDSDETSIPWLFE